MEHLSRVRSCCEEGTCTIKVIRLAENIMDLKMRPLKGAKFAKIMRDIEEDRIPYLREKIGNVDWHCAFIYQLRNAIGKGSKT